jgi:hypothetical protein
MKDAFVTYDLCRRPPAEIAVDLSHHGVLFRDTRAMLFMLCTDID